MTKPRGVLLVLATGLVAIAFAAAHRAHVLAEGAPTEQPLFYSGTLEVDGAPASGEYTVTMTLHDAASGGNELCGVTSNATVEGGRFRIDASDCRQAVADEPDSWIEISFTGSDDVAHPIPGRAKIGAVPYALQADHAVSASSPSGALATTIQQLTERVNALETAGTSSAFVAHKTTAQTIASGEGRVVIFDEVRFNIGNEYNPSTGKFVAKVDGLYEFSCTIAWEMGMNTAATYEVALQLNGFELTFNGSYGDGIAATRSLTRLIDLKAGDTVACTALQTFASTAPLNIFGGGYNTFSGHRL
jgi:hypothetical protein